MSRQQKKSAAGQAAVSSPGPEAHQGGLFGPNQSIFTPAQPSSDSPHVGDGSATEDIHRQLAALQAAVRSLKPTPPPNPTPPSPTSFLSFISPTSGPDLRGLQGSTSVQSARGGGSSRGGAHSTQFSAGDLREIFNPRKPVEEPRLHSLTVVTAVDFLTKWHEHSASVHGTSAPIHLSLLIAPPALQTIADKNDVAPDFILSTTNFEIANLIAKAVSFGKGPADALSSIASHCSLRRLNTSTFASFHIRFEILCFLFGPTNIPEKLLAKAFCNAIHNTRASGHLASLHLSDWRALAQLLKNAILQREALDPFFGPHRDEATSKPELQPSLASYKPGPRVSQQQQQPEKQLQQQQEQQLQQQPRQPREQLQQRPQQQREPHQSRPSSFQRSAAPTPASHFQPRSVAAHAAQVSGDATEPPADSEYEDHPASEEDTSDS